MSYIKIFYIFLLLFISGTTNVFAVNLYNWDIPPISPVDYYESIYMSPDSSVIVASGPNRSDRYSHDLGNVWTISTGVSAGVKKYASNYDGSILLSVKSGEKIKISTDKGITFTEISDSRIKDWRGGIAVSEDGQKIVAAAYGEYIWVSSDAGNTWFSKNTPISDGGTNRWWDIDLASNNTGDYIIVGAGLTGGSVWISPDFGESWTEVVSLGLRDWRAVKVSPNGQDMYAAANNNHIYKSTNSGQGWDPITPNTGSLTAFDVTSTGSAMVASRQSDVYVSIDNGQNWNVESVGISQPINSISISEDRKNIFIGRAGSLGRMSRGSLILSNYTLDTISPNGSITRDPDLVEYEEGSEVTLTAVPDEGYQFVEWVGGCVGMGTECTFVMNENKSITANFELITYTISYDANTAISGTVPSNQTKTYDVDITIASNIELEKTGYTFTGWNTEPDGSGVGYLEDALYTSNSNLILYAQWEINQYALNAVALNGSIVQNPNLAEYNHGTELTLTAVPDEGYQFVEWVGDCLGTDLECVLTMDTEKNIEAVFELIPSARRSGSVGVIGQLGIQMQPLQTPTLPTTIPGLQALVAQLQAQLQQLISQTPTQSQAPLQNSFTRDLEIGMEGDGVRQLQNLLISKGYGIPAGVTGFFGSQTQSALIRFQQENNITPAVGYFGPITRSVLTN